jgi:hypothetical protein
MTMRRGALLSGAVVAAVVLGGCGSSPDIPRVRQDSQNVSLNGCDKVACTGTLAGAPYEILLPSSWNGTLLIYSHGYRNAAPIPPDFTPVSTAAEPAPGWSEGDKDTGQALLDQGFALAGSA